MEKIEKKVSEDVKITLIQTRPVELISFAHDPKKYKRWLKDVGLDKLSSM